MPPTSSETDLGVLGRELARLRRRSFRLERNRATNWESWSSTVEETNALAYRIGGAQPVSIADLVVRYEALHWLMIEADDVIMDVEAKRAFIGFGRALKGMG